MATSVLPSDLQCQRSTLSRYGHASPVARTTALSASAVAALSHLPDRTLVTDRDRDRSAKCAENLLLENRYPAPVYAFDNRHDRAQLALVLGDNMAVKTDPEAVRRQRITLLTNALTATRHHRAADVAASAQLKELLSRFFERIQQIEQRGTSSEEDIAFLHELLEQGFQLKGSSQAEIDACHARLASDNGGQA